MFAARARTTTATYEMQNVMWAIDSWRDRAPAVEQLEEEQQQRQAHDDLGGDHRDEQERLGRRPAAEPDPGEPEAEQRTQDRRHDDRDDGDLERHPERVEELVVREAGSDTSRA